MLEKIEIPNIDCLIVGQGIAGSLVAWQLMQQHKKVVVIDEGLAITSSKIAAGMFNPINTKRFTIAQDAEASIKQALSIYTAIEQQFGVTLIHHNNIYNVFGNTKESNDYTLKANHPFFKQYTEPNPLTEPNINQPFGAFEVKLSGWIDTKKMIEAIRKHLIKKQYFMEAVFDYSVLVYENEYWNYKGVKAQAIIFCEGYKAQSNPFFTNLHIIPCKGDVLEFEAPALQLTRVVKKGIYIVSLGNGKYKCGSLYKWENADTTTHQADYDELQEKIAQLIQVPFTITAHYTAVRPTTKTREIMVLKHAELPNMYALNGLGTKGVINGVKAVGQLLKTLAVSCA